MAKPKPATSGRPEVPVPARTDPEGHPLDGQPGEQPRSDVETPVRREAVTSRRREPTASRSRAAVKPERRDEPEQEQPVEPVKPVRRATTTPKRRDVTKSRRRAPSVEDSVALTVRFDPDEYNEIDEWLLSLRRELGRARLDKSEVVRALLLAARERADVRRALLALLKS